MLVSSKLNPADLATQSHTLAKLMMWFHGPDFLGSELRNLQLTEVFMKNTDNDIDVSSESRSKICIPDD